ncbi:MAG TPA: hypothetical protein PK522_00745 [Nitrosomonas sp.]|nr:hypothetical protein [Nitrosomonas sp.]
MKMIDEKTGVPMFAVITAVPTLFGFIIWLSSISFTANSAKSEVAELKSKQNAQNELLLNIKEDLTLIKYKLEIKEKR